MHGDDSVDDERDDDVACGEWTSYTVVACLYRGGRGIGAVLVLVVEEQGNVRSDEDGRMTRRTGTRQRAASITRTTGMLRFC